MRLDVNCIRSPVFILLCYCLLALHIFLWKGKDKRHVICVCVRVILRQKVIVASIVRNVPGEITELGELSV